MNEIEVINQQILGLIAADARIDDLFKAGKISPDERESWQIINENQRDRLRARRGKLLASGSGVTPVISDAQAQALRDGVRELQGQVASMDALEKLINEVLNVAEAMQGAAGPQFGLQGLLADRTFGASGGDVGGRASIAQVAITAIVAIAAIAGISVDPRVGGEG